MILRSQRMRIHSIWSSYLAPEPVEGQVRLRVSVCGVCHNRAG